MYQHIQFDIREGVAYIRLNRPEVFNSVNQPMAFELLRALDACAADSNIRCVVITGQGKAFCAGQDLKEVTDPNGPPLQDIVREHYNPLITRMRSLEKPVVCAVNGVAAGAGANIALAGDVVVASASASFVQAFSKIGLIPDSGGTWILPRLIGFQRASALMMLGDKVAAADALQMGMLYAVYADEQFEAEVEKLARILAAMPTYGLALTKKVLNASFENSLQAQLALEEQVQTQAGSSADYREGVNAFLEKRKPNFTGQ